MLSNAEQHRPGDRNRSCATGPLYWEERWRVSTNRYDSSWTGDRAARLLELREVYQDLLQVKPYGLVEFGCGPFTLDEDRKLEELLGQLECYYGQDVSPSALGTAMHYTSRKFTRGGLFWSDMNEAIWTPSSTECYLALSRRVIQNLRPERQERVVAQICSEYQHGLLIERTVEDARAVNEERAKLGKTALPVPHHNNYLSHDLIDRLRSFGWISITYPLSRYFHLTRVTEELEKGDYDGYVSQYSGCTCGLPGMGPAAIRW